MAKDPLARAVVRLADGLPTLTRLSACCLGDRPDLRWEMQASQAASNEHAAPDISPVPHISLG